MSVAAWVGMSVLSGALGLLNAAVPGGYDVRTAAYGPDPRMVLDVYRPRGVSHAPVVVFFYGGRWMGGDRHDYKFAAEAFTSRGYVVVLPDTRVYPQVTFPGFMEDGARAVRWAHDHVAEDGGDPARMFLVGHSSGAHIAVLLNLDAHYLNDAGVPFSAIRGAVGLSGPYDFMPFAPDIQDVMGPEARWPASQPINFARADAPPMFLAQGRADTIVDPRNTEHLVARQQALGGQVSAKFYPHLDHYFMVAALGAPLRFLAPVRDDVVAWLKERLL